MATKLRAEYFVFDTPTEDAGGALKVAAKRYTDGRGSPDGFTLFLVHGAGSHKEHWEPTLQSIFEIQRTKNTKYQIREAWAFDWQSHGDSATLNKDVLKSRPEGVPVRQWGSFLAAFAKSEHVRGHRIVAIGHSAGTCAIVLSMCDLPLHDLPYHSVILVENPMVKKEIHNEHKEEIEFGLRMLSKVVLSRRDIWSSREEALSWFSKRRPWNGWDARVLAIYVEHGLRPVNSSKVAEGVTIKCDKQIEVTSYTDVDAYFDATEALTRLAPNIPIHLIYGALNDQTPRYAQDSVADAGRGCFISITRVAEVGHMILQEKPEELASVIAAQLNVDMVATAKL